eukprot:5370941-Prymnesium_polylepis.2
MRASLPRAHRTLQVPRAPDAAALARGPLRLRGEARLVAGGSWLRGEEVIAPSPQTPASRARARRGSCEARRRSSWRRRCAGCAY